MTTIDNIMELADAYAISVADAPQHPTPLLRAMAVEKIEKAREALRTALTKALAAQPLREPEMEPSCNKRFPRNSELMLPTKPPVNQWEVHQWPAREPLTPEHIELIYNRYGGDMINCTRAIERAHGIGGAK